MTIDGLHVGDSADAWRSIGFDVGEDNCCRVGSVRIQLGGDGNGITGWTLRDTATDHPDVDGVPTASSATPPGEPGKHPTAPPASITSSS